MMIKFIKQTANEPDFYFRIHGTTEDAAKFLHRMRMHLSRFREVVKNANRVPRPFKVITQSMEYDKETGITTVHLRKEQGANVKIAEEINEIFQEIAGGEKIK